MRSKSTLGLVVALLILVLGVGLALYWVGTINSGRTQSSQATSSTTAPNKPVAPSGAAVPYNPPKPEDAPEDIREAVLLGHSIVSDTIKTLPNDIGNQVNCTNCHFNAGMTQGGKNGGISLVGVAATYPKYRDRQKFAVDLVARVND